jgi:hypothetical protein
LRLVDVAHERDETGTCYKATDSSLDAENVLSETRQRRAGLVLRAQQYFNDIRQR